MFRDFSTISQAAKLFLENLSNSLGKQSYLLLLLEAKTLAISVIFAQAVQPYVINETFAICFPFP